MIFKKKDKSTNGFLKLLGLFPLLLLLVINLIKRNLIVVVFIIVNIIIVRFAFDREKTQFAVLDYSVSHISVD